MVYPKQLHLFYTKHGFFSMIIVDNFVYWRWIGCGRGVDGRVFHIFVEK